MMFPTHVSTVFSLSCGWTPCFVVVELQVVNIFAILPRLSLFFSCIIRLLSYASSELYTPVSSFWRKVIHSWSIFAKGGLTRCKQLGRFLATYEGYLMRSRVKPPVFTLTTCCTPRTHKSLLWFKEESKGKPLPFLIFSYSYFLFSVFGARFF